MKNAARAASIIKLQLLPNIRHNAINGSGTTGLHLQTSCDLIGVLTILCNSSILLDP